MALRRASRERVTVGKAMEPTLISADDERAIRALVVRYAHAVSRADADALESTWAANCHFELAGTTGDGKVMEGRDVVVGYQREHMGWYESLVQMVGEGLIWSTSEGVEGRWTVWEVGRWAGSATDRMGVVAYADRYVHEDGRWVIASRRLTVHYDNRGLPTGTFVALQPLPF